MFVGVQFIVYLHETITPSPPRGRGSCSPSFLNENIEGFVGAFQGVGGINQIVKYCFFSSGVFSILLLIIQASFVMEK